MTIRPLSSKVIFVAPRNMTRQGERRPFPPTFSHWAPLWNRGRAMSIQNSEKFVAFTKTYVEGLMSKTTVSQSREAHSLLTISGLPNELYTVVRRKLRRVRRFRPRTHADRKSTRLNSSHVANSYAVFCFK